MWGVDRFVFLQYTAHYIAMYTFLSIVFVVIEFLSNTYGSYTNGYRRQQSVTAAPQYYKYYQPQRYNWMNIQQAPWQYGHHQAFPPSGRADKQIQLELGGAVPHGINAGLQAIPVAGYQNPIAPIGPNPGLQAIVHLQPDEDSGVIGDLVFTQVVPNGPVMIEGNITGLTPGLHGIHVHQAGAVKENCQEIGNHFTAYYGRHGGPRDHIRHVGDLGNIKADEGTTVVVKIVDHLISLAGPRSIVGRSLGISKGEDDYGRAGTEESGLTGTSGPTIACGIIGYLH